MHESDEAPTPGDAGGDDAAWREIVDNYGERPEIDEEADQKTDPATPMAEPEEGWFNAEPIDLDGEDTYVPPPPPPVELDSPARTLAWIGVLGAPVLALALAIVTAFVTWSPPGWLFGALVIAFLGGFGYLIATMPTDPGDPWDDGARV